ncbi:hypothetical protein MBANPS3_003615 [Mucor bainieri]
MTDPYGTPYTNDPTDLKYMQLSIEEANKSIPAPAAYCVGAALVDAQGQLLSVGYSRELPGNTHAEECALIKIADKNINTEGATIRIIEAKIKRVAVGVREPPNLVACEGISLLEREGIQVVIVPNVQEACLKPNQHILNK